MRDLKQKRPVDLQLRGSRCNHSYTRIKRKRLCVVVFAAAGGGPGATPLPPFTTISINGTTGTVNLTTNTFKIIAKDGSEFTLKISDVNQFKTLLTSDPPDSDFEKGVIWELLNLQAQSIPLTPMQTIWLRNANRSDVITIIVGQAKNFNKTAYVFDVGDVIEVKMLFKFLLERVAQATQVINTSRQTILVDQYAHTNALNYMSDTYNFYFLVIEKNTNKITAEEIMQLIKDKIFDQFLFNFVSNQIVLEQISLKLNLKSLAERKLVNRPFTLAGGLTGTDHLPSGRSFLIRTSSLGLSNNNESGSHRLPFVTRSLEVFNRQNNVSEISLMVKFCEMLQEPVVYQLKDVNGNLTELKLCFAIKTDKPDSVMPFLPIISALPVGLIANSKNSSSPILSSDSFILDNGQNGGGMNIP